MYRVHVKRIARFALILAACAPIQDAPINPPLDLEGLEGLEGRVVYLDFWASWCVPWRRSFPWMESMRHAYESRGLTIIAVNLDHDRPDAEPFLARFPANFMVHFDPEGVLAEKYKVSGMPTSVVIDRHGAVRFTHVGFKPSDGDAYEKQLQQLLDER
jgi:thiol-disulfide isomerase/thioredoxin